MNKQEYIDLTDYQKIIDVNWILSNIVPEISSIITSDDYIIVMKIIDKWKYLFSRFSRKEFINE